MKTKIVDEEGCKILEMTTWLQACLLRTLKMNNNNKSSYSKTKLIAIYRYLITFLNGEIIILLMRDGTQT